MKYISEKDIKEMGVNWREVFDAIVKATQSVHNNDYSQPVKPYLRYRDPKNRIIAMPAWLGGDVDTAGIKWIASFPGNIEKGIPRAHSIIILNESASGKPYAIINTALVSAIRTAGVSGAVINRYLQADNHPERKVTAGIIGMGPIGQTHVSMLSNAFADDIDRICVYDINPIDLVKLQAGSKVKIVGCKSWQEVFEQADVFLTCTVSGSRYINIPPRAAALYLNVSLRDFEAAFMQQVDLMIVDNWEEVCRENTDIAFMNAQHSLQESDVYTIGDVLLGDLLKDSAAKSVMFNPMGMAVFDIAVARYYYELSNRCAIGTIMEA
jgi:2,3-diaminopropionate biosynthesis protein SbnB